MIQNCLCPHCTTERTKMISMVWEKLGKPRGERGKEYIALLFSHETDYNLQAGLDKLEASFTKGKSNGNVEM